MGREVFHSRVFLFGLGLLFMSLPLSLYVMSASQLLLVGNWLIEGQFRRKWEVIRRRPEIWVFLIIFLIHVLGLLHTIDFQYAAKDIRTKLPLVVLPLIIGTARPVSKRNINILLLLYVLAVVLGTFRSVAELWLSEVYDIRQISVFISHIRFSLNICLAIFILIWLLHHDKSIQAGIRLTMALAVAWLIVFLFVLQSLTGLVVFLITAVVLLIRHGLHLPKARMRYLIFSLACVLPLAVLGYIGFLIDNHSRIDKVDFSSLQETTSKGEAYHHDTLNCQTVNGHYVWIYLAENELREEWNNRSELDYDGLDRQGHHLRDILIRYLTSQGLRKDADGLARLSDEEINMIEEGKANATCDGPNVVKSRICEILWEYRNYQCTGDPSGHSVLMRYEYWKTSCHIIRKNFWVGVGTGDMNIAFRDAYEEMGSRLSPEWRLRSHNQFLSIFVGFGLLGLMLFLLAVIYPVFRARPLSGFLVTAFLSIVILSMITEDTIESQAGVTFFALFYCIFLFLPIKDDA